MSTVPTNEDTFDRLLAALPQIAEAVNTFASEEVQRSVFAALVQALRIEDAPRPASPSPAAPPLAPPVTHLDSPVTEAEGDSGQDQNKSESPARTGRRRNGRSKRSFAVQKGLNFAPDGNPSLEEFVAQKSPRNLDERNLVACYYLSEMMNLDAIDVSHVLAVYQAIEAWKASTHPDTSLQSTASKYGWIDTSDMKDIKVVWKGSNYIASKMPSKTEAKKAA